MVMGTIPPPYRLIKPLFLQGFFVSDASVIRRVTL